MSGIFQNGAFSAGFDNQPPIGQLFTQSQSGAWSNVTPYGFGYSLQVYSSYVHSGANSIFFNVNLPRVIVGAAVYVANLTGSPYPIFNWYDVTANAYQLQLRINSIGQLQFFLGTSGTSVGPVSTVSLASGTGVWYYIECDVTIAASGAGSVKCNVNGTNVIPTTAGTTQASANAYANLFAFECGGNIGGSIYVDDWYMLDSTGASPLNAMLGPVQVRGNAASANSAIGGRNAFTPTSPTGVNYSNVANVPASATEYNSDSNPGDYDMFQFPSLPSSVSSVFFTNTWAQLELDVAGSRTVEIDTYSSGTDSASSAFMPNVGTPGALQ